MKEVKHDSGEESDIPYSTVPCGGDMRLMWHNNMTSGKLYKQELLNMIGMRNIAKTGGGNMFYCILVVMK